MKNKHTTGVPRDPDITYWEGEGGGSMPYVNLSHGASSYFLSFIFGFGKESLSYFLLLFLVYKNKVLFFSFYSYYLYYEKNCSIPLREF